MKKQSATTKEKKSPGRKTRKVRSHISLTPTLSAAAEFLGKRTFGNKTAFLEHLILRELERQGLDIGEIEKLAAEWDAKHAHESH